MSWEWVFIAVSLLLLLGAIGFVVYRRSTRGTGADDGDPDAEFEHGENPDHATSDIEDFYGSSSEYPEYSTK